MKNISSVQNDKVKSYVRLSSRVSERVSTGLFTFEGIKLLREARISGLDIKQMFITEECLSRYHDEITKASDECAEVYLITGNVADKLADTKQPQGVFVTAGCFEQTLSVERIRKGGRYVLLCRISDPGNLGTIVRGAEAMGIDGVILSGDCCDIYSYKAVRASMGSLFRLPILTQTDVPGFLRDLSDTAVVTYASVLDEDAVGAADHKFESDCVLCLGNEGDGLPDEVTGACIRKIIIEMQGRAQSLNVAAAAMIFMWEMGKGKNQ